MSHAAAPDSGEVTADPFASDAPIEFRSDAELEEKPDGSSVGQMWFSYAARAALGDLAG